MNIIKTLSTLTLASGLALGLAPHAEAKDIGRPIADRCINIVGWQAPGIHSDYKPRKRTKHIKFDCDRKDGVQEMEVCLRRDGRTQDLCIWDSHYGQRSAKSYILVRTKGKMKKTVISDSRAHRLSGQYMYDE